MQPPNEVRNFVHRRIFGAVKGFAGGGPVGAVGGFASGGGRPSKRRGGQPKSTRGGFNVTRESLGKGRCPKGRKQVGNRCVKPGAFLPGGVPFTTGTSVARFEGQGGAYLPTMETREVRECLPGDVLGRDGFCYAKGSISNKNREWPKGRRPLGTPGEMAALAKAASFGRRMETTVKRMQKIGVLKKPSRGRSTPRARAVVRGGHAHVLEEITN